MDNGPSFDTPGVPGGVQVSNEKNIFDFSLSVLLAKTAFRGSFYDTLEKRLTKCIKSGH